jgi:hypothetical protein
MVVADSRGHLSMWNPTRELVVVLFKQLEAQPFDDMARILVQVVHRLLSFHF